MIPPSSFPNRIALSGRARALTELGTALRSIRCGAALLVAGAAHERERGLGLSLLQAVYHAERAAATLRRGDEGQALSTN